MIKTIIVKEVISTITKRISTEFENFIKKEFTEVNKSEIKRLKNDFPELYENHLTEI